MWCQHLPLLLFSADIDSKHPQGGVSIHLLPESVYVTECAQACFFFEWWRAE